MAMMPRSGAAIALASRGVVSATKPCNERTSSRTIFLSVPEPVVTTEPNGTSARWSVSSVRRICSSRNAPRCEARKANERQRKATETSASPSATSHQTLAASRESLLISREMGRIRRIDAIHATPPSTARAMATDTSRRTGETMLHRPASSAASATPAPDVGPTSSA